jgi:hypothetical protein
MSFNPETIMSKSTRAGLATGLLFVLAASSCYKNAHEWAKSNPVATIDATSSRVPAAGEDHLSIAIDVGR